MRFDARVTFNAHPGIVHVRIVLPDCDFGLTSWLVKLPSEISFHAAQSVLDAESCGMFSLEVENASNHILLFSRKTYLTQGTYEAVQGPNIIPMVKTKNLLIFTQNTAIANKRPHFSIDLWGRIIRRFSNRKE